MKITWDELQHELHELQWKKKKCIADDFLLKLTQAEDEEE